MMGYVKIPNWIIEDNTMYDTTKKVLVTLMACTGSSGSICKSQQELAQITGFCRNTVSKALRELSERGLLLSTKRYRFSRAQNCVVRAASRYYVQRVERCIGGYTLVPRCLIAEDLTPAGFTAALYVYKLSGRKGRCCPSLRRFAKLCDHAKATVCRVLERLWRCQSIVRLYCRKVNGSLSCNSYYTSNHVGKNFSVRGGLKNEQPLSKKKDNDGSYLENREIGVFQFGNLPNFDDFSQLFWDGGAVRVCVTEEQFLA